MNDYILSLDPSGAYCEGKGTTGWCLYDARKEQFILKGSLSAITAKSDADYWHQHIQLIELLRQSYPIALLVEDYVLYAHKADAQINSRFETSQLIGVIKHYAYIEGIPMYMQCAAEVKTRWANPILVKKGILHQRKNKFYLKNIEDPVSKHELDSIRHAVHFNTFYNR